MAYLVNVTWDLPLVLGIVFAIAITALLGIALEKIMWAPMRSRGAGMLQLLLMTIGLAFVIRYGIQFVWGTELRQLDVNNTATVDFLGLRIGRTQLIMIVVGFVDLDRHRADVAATRCSASACARSPTTSTWPRPPASTPRG